MNETSYFIQDRALTLPYEARRFPQTAEVALVWLRLALAWAGLHGHYDLAEMLQNGIAVIEDGMEGAA